MGEDSFGEAQRWADNPEAWKDPERCEAWIRIMQAIAADESERPETRAEAELLAKRLRHAKSRAERSAGD